MNMTDSNIDGSSGAITRAEHLMLARKLKRARWFFGTGAVVAVISIALNVLLFRFSGIIAEGRDDAYSDLGRIRDFSARILDQNRFLIRLVDLNKEHIQPGELEVASPDGVEPILEVEGIHKFGFIFFDFSENGVLKEIDIINYPPWAHELYKMECQYTGCLQGKTPNEWGVDADSFLKMVEERVRARRVGQ